MVSLSNHDICVTVNRPVLSNVSSFDKLRMICAERLRATYPRCLTRYPEDFQKLIAAYLEEVAKSYLTVSKEVIEWIKQNEKLKK